MNRSRILLTYRISITTVLILLLSAYTNCSPLGKQTADTQGKATGSGPDALNSGNGGVYDGKPAVFISVLPTGTCADGSNLKTEISVDANKSAHVLRQNCAAVSKSPVAFEDLAIMPHNPANALFNGQVLDEKVTKLKVTSYLCRGVKAREFSDGLYSIAADTVIRSLGSPPPPPDADGLTRGAYSAELKLGIYDIGKNLISSPFNNQNFALNYYLSENGKYDVFVAIVTYQGARYRVKVFINLGQGTGILEFSPEGTIPTANPPLVSITDPPSHRLELTCHGQ